MIRISDKTLWGSEAPRGLGLLAVLLAGWSAAPAFAETLVFRNDCNAPVIVQAAGVFRGIFRRDRPYLLRPGDATPGIVLPGDKVITIYDAKMPNRILYQGALPANSTDLRFRILPDVPPPRVRIQMQAPPKP
jgi:hypothetical protein